MSQKEPLAVGTLLRHLRLAAGVCAEIGEEAWRRAWESGQSMTLEEAMAYALHARQE